MDNLNETDPSWKKLRTTKRCILLCEWIPRDIQSGHLWLSQTCYWLTRAKYHQVETYNAYKLDVPLPWRYLECYLAPDLSQLGLKAMVLGNFWLTSFFGPCWAQIIERFRLKTRMHHWGFAFVYRRSIMLAHSNIASEAEGLKRFLALEIVI